MSSFDEMQKHIQQMKFKNDKDFSSIVIQKAINRVVGCLVLDNDGAIKGCNDYFTDMLGMTMDDLHGKPFFDFLHEDDKQRTLNAFKGVKENGSLGNFRNRYVNLKGKVVFVEWEYSLNMQNVTVGICRKVEKH